ncbi:Hypothetical protein PHPALM_37913, partial [Phytophthora palmivora]
MDLALSVVDGLREINYLGDAIRRQRRVNRKTYLRMMEVYVELHMSESLQSNPTLQRTGAIERFAKAVDTFQKYLRKYHDMRWGDRFFKRAAMEKEREKVVDEIDRLLQMVNLASNIAVINAAACKNSSRPLTKYDDNKITIEQMHAGPVADEEQIELTRTKETAESEPVNKKMINKMTPRPETTLENGIEGEGTTTCVEMEEETPVDIKNDLNSNTDTVETRSVLPTAGEKALCWLKHNAVENAVEVNHSTDSDKVEETAPAASKLEVESSSADVTSSSKLPEVWKVEFTKSKQSTMDHEAQIDDRKSLPDSITNEVVVEETVDQTSQRGNSTSSTGEDPSVPLLIQLLGSNDATSQQKEEALLRLLRKCINNNNRVQVYRTKGIPVLAHLVRSSDSFFTQLYALHCLSWFTFSYSKMRESEFVELQRCVRQPTHPEILSLLHELQREDEQVKEVAVLQCSCLATRGDGVVLRQVGVLPAVIVLLKAGTSNQKLWAAETLVTLASDREDEQVKEVAVLQCSCLATRGDGVVLRQVGVLPPVIELLKSGTSNQKLWAAETLVTLASDDDDNCEAIMRGGAIPPLVTLLRSGTDMQKQEAAYALGNLAANNEVNRGKIAREGAIPPMVAFVKAVTDAQNQWAVYALGFLSVNNEENRVLIAQEG